MLQSFMSMNHQETIYLSKHQIDDKSLGFRNDSKIEKHVTWLLTDFQIVMRILLMEQKVETTLLVLALHLFCLLILVKIFLQSLNSTRVLLPKCQGKCGKPITHWYSHCQILWKNDLDWKNTGKERFKYRPSYIHFLDN